MNEHIVAGLPADKAEAFGVVKPLHCSLFHCVTCFYWFEFLLRRIAAGDMGIAGWRNRPSTAGESNLADKHWMCHPRERFISMAGRQTNPWAERPDDYGVKSVKRLESGRSCQFNPPNRAT